ncbi:AbrB/MazE/SpoVT family DNA-binding domain-containing protein [Microbacterium marinilacus]|uniref:SpoVT-AbrB domain-containing protein n=2 Tax=Microbacterium marinilacus TaxID=415209 RepID=A0ABP7BVL1_9MICO|nr:AbrB/MazE/SpoVT family DNA-binding domain-containing protein [Microbacterium marinilacus]
MDKAGRIVVPAELRARLGLVPGPVDMVMDGAAIRIEFPVTDAVVERDGILMVPDGGRELTPDDVRELRLADQR